MKRNNQDHSVWSVLDPSLLHNSSSNSSTSRKHDKNHKKIEERRETYLDYSLPEYEHEFTAKFIPSSSSSSSSLCYNIASPKDYTQPKKRKNKHHFRHFGSPFTETETSSEDGDTITTKDVDNEENAALLKACLEEVQNIEKELFFHRKSIYKEKLRNLEKELLSIENYQHKAIKKEDKKQEKIRDKRLADAEAFYNAELQALDKKCKNDLNAINKDAQVAEDNIRKAITSSIPSNHHNHKRQKPNQEIAAAVKMINTPITTEEEEKSNKDTNHKSPSPTAIVTSPTITTATPATTSALPPTPTPPPPTTTTTITTTTSENPTSIAIKKKISTFQAIEERKKAIYSMKEINKKTFVNDDEADLDNDLMRMRKKITQ